MGSLLLRSTDVRFAIPGLVDEHPSDPLLAAAVTRSLKTGYSALAPDGSTSRRVADEAPAHPPEELVASPPGRAYEAGSISNTLLHRPRARSSSGRARPSWPNLTEPPLNTPFSFPGTLDERPSDPLLVAAEARSLRTGISQLESASLKDRAGTDVEATRLGKSLTAASPAENLSWPEARLDAQDRLPESLSWDSHYFSCSAGSASSAGTPFPVHPQNLAQALLSASLGSSTKGLISWDPRRQTYALDRSLKDASVSGLERRALEVGSWARRIEESVKVLRADKGVQSVGHAFASALDDIVESILAPLQGVHPDTTLSVSSKLASAHEVLATLASALSLQNLRRSPKLPIKALRDPLKVLSLSWALLESAVYSSAPQEVTDALRWLWECIGKEWAKGVELWLAGEDEGAWAVGAVWDEVEWSFVAGRLPTFLPAELGRDLFFGGFALRLLKEAAPSHPLCGTGKKRGQDRVFAGWCWSKAQSQRQRADWAARETSTKERVASWRRGDSLALSPTSSSQPAVAAVPAPLSAISAEKRVKDLGRLFALQPTASLLPAVAESEANVTMPDFIASDMDPLASSTLPTMIAESLDPLRSHAALVSHSLLASLFATSVNGHILHHFSVLSRFLLFRENFPFVSRLKHALFGDGQSEDRAVGLGARARIRERMGIAPSATHAGGSARGGVALGLGLSDRTSWPPGGAELNIALRNTLIEAIDEHAFSAASVEAGVAWREMEDRLGFVVRDPPQEAGDRWRDPGRIEALDFLQVSYRPPKELRVVVSRLVLDRYLQIQGLLLRLFRGEAVIRYIHLSTSRPSCPAIFPAGSPADKDLVAFRHSATLFVASILNWIFDDVLLVRYGSWEARLAALSADLSAGRNTGSIATVQDLLQAHEKVLTDVSSSLWLGAGQEQAMAALLECLWDCLKVGALVRDGIEGGWADGSVDEQAAMATMGALRRSFETSSQTFVLQLSSAVRGLVRQDFSPLLVRLDASRRASAASRFER